MNHLSVSIWYAFAASALQVALVVLGGPLLLGFMAKIRARAEATRVSCSRSPPTSS